MQQEGNMNWVEVDFAKTRQEPSKVQAFEFLDSPLKFHRYVSIYMYQLHFATMKPN